jgi:lipoprotein-anchoring transpeptidase ErfK/SrfK
LRKSKDKVAVIDQGKQFSFGEVGRWAKNCAALIIKKGAGVRRPVPVFLPKSAQSIVANIGVLYSANGYANLDIKVRKSPSAKAKSIGKLHFNTEDGPPEIYLALQLFTDANGNEWVQTQLPGRPNGRLGWVPREGLGEFHLIHTQLVVNRRTLRATLFKNGKKIFQAPVGVGKASTPTPGGAFWIREKLKGFGAVYGPLAFGTAAYSNTLTDWPGGGVVGVHGTNEPNLVPGRPSHGCVRMHNKDILRLARLMNPGTPLLIL